MLMETNQKGIELIKRFEGCKLQSYKCPAGVWTIGYGHTHMVKPGQSITEKQAETLLRNDLAVFERGVTSATAGCFLTSNQFSALVSFAFNVGVANLRNSTLLKKVRSNPDDKAIAYEFRKWVYANGKPLDGLAKRREAESDLYFSKV